MIHVEWSSLNLMKVCSKLHFFSSSLYLTKFLFVELSEAHRGVLPGKQESFGSQREKVGEKQGESEHALRSCVNVAGSVHQMLMVLAFKNLRTKI